MKLMPELGLHFHFVDALIYYWPYMFCCWFLKQKKFQFIYRFIKLLKHHAICNGQWKKMLIRVHDFKTVFRLRNESSVKNYQTI